MNYTTTFIFSFLISFILTPICGLLAKKFSILDHPVSEIKTHKTPIPYLGGVAIALSFYFVLFLVRITTHFPTGTLRSLRGIVYGSVIVLVLGLIDDLKYKGIHYSTKFMGELVACIIVMLYGIKINFVKPDWMAIIITLLWIIGITNAINLIDVMDGLSSGVAVISSIGLFLITKFVEEEIYVGFATLSLAGACLGFLPYNLSERYKIFMGDTGALFIGYILATIALGSKYSTNNTLAVFAPVIILLVPIYETILISILRLNRGQSPFVGSKDHFSLRLLSFGFSKFKVLAITYSICILLVIFGIIITLSKNIYVPLTILFLLLVMTTVITKFLVKIEI